MSDPYRNVSDSEWWWFAYEFRGQKTMHVGLGLGEHGADLLQPLAGFGGQLQEAAVVC